MICHLTDLQDRTQSAIVAHLTGELESVCGEELTIDADNVQELARAVECFVEEEVGGDAVDSKYLVLLASRALTSLGEGTAAQRMLLFGTGLLKPAEWEVSGSAAMWVLDLRQMTVRDDAGLELVFFGSVNMILEAMAYLWDASEGSGVLGLRHVCLTAASILGDGARDVDVFALAQELRSMCSAKLEQIGQERGWSSLPHVLNLDF